MGLASCDRHDEPMWVRPLVRYVDEDQAVIDTHVFLRRSRHALLDDEARRQPVDVIIRMADESGQQTRELRARVQNGAAADMVRFELHDPERWWPAGMGDQHLYRLTVVLVTGGKAIDTFETTIGLTSVRPGASEDDAAQTVLLVNGRHRAIQAIVPIDPVDEDHLIACAGDYLLLVRDHFAPDVLYAAADRAGILLVQSVPSGSADAVTGSDLRSEVDRLVGHPSLAGWLVQDHDDQAQQTVSSLQALDPTRNIFRHLGM